MVAVGIQSESSSQTRPDGVIRSLIPARLDRLRWSRFHTRLVMALGVAWVLDGLEITIAGNAACLLSSPKSLGLSSAGVGFAVGTVYLLGEVAGALFFGRLSDRWGRRNLFVITLGVYLLGGAMTALTLGHGEGWVLYLYLCRFIAGMGIGGEYAAINSAIDELIPSRYRGRVDIAVNGTYWGGALLATLVTLAVINNLSVGYSWRIAFLAGPALGFLIIFVRRNLPESPRWLLMQGRVDEAEAAVAEIERNTIQSGGSFDEVDESKAIEVRPARQIGFVALARTLFATYPRRSILGASLMITQSFLYNAIFFTYSLVLTKIYGVPKGSTPYYFMFFAAGNLLGPLHDRPALRHDRPPQDDHRNVPSVRNPAGGQRLPLQCRTSGRGQPDGVLVRDLLLRLRRRQCRLSHRQRDLSGGGPGQGHRRVLRHCSVLRCLRTMVLRKADRRWQRPLQAVHRLPHRRSRDGGGRADRGVPRYRCGGPLARRPGPAARRHRPPAPQCPGQRDRRTAPAGGPHCRRRWILG